MKNTIIFAEKSNFTHHTDKGFVIAMLLLLGLGIVTLYATSSNYALKAFNDSLYFLKRQLVNCGIGLVFLIFLSIIDISKIRKVLPYICLGAFILCILTFIPGIGVERNGARRWIKIPFFGSFQPSELVKLTVILFLANLFDKKYDRLDDASVSIVPGIVGLAAYVLIVFLQDDFSTAFFIMMIGLSIFFIVGVKLRWFVGFCVFSFPIVFLFIFTESYRVQRLIAFFNPDKYSHGVNYQVNASCRAISSGGIFGEGFDSGLKRVTGIPEAQADFIFAGWTEAMGFIGVLLFFILIIFFAWKGYQIAFKCENKFNSYLVFGIITSIVLQTVINCGVVCGALPSTGIPLPFFSSGGSSLIVTLIMCGLVINVSNNNEVEMCYE